MPGNTIASEKIKLIAIVLDFPWHLMSFLIRLDRNHLEDHHHQHPGPFPVEQLVQEMVKV